MERASKHIPHKKIRNNPHSGNVIVSSNTAMKLQKNNITAQKSITILLNSATNWNQRYSYMWLHLFIFWWWHMQAFIWFCICRNISSDVFDFPSFCGSLSFLKVCSDMICACLISSSAALSFSIWLQATHTSVANRLGKPNTMLMPKNDATTCKWLKIMI